MKKNNDDIAFMNYEYLKREIDSLRRTRQIYLYITVFTSAVFLGLMVSIGGFRPSSNIAITVFLIITGYAQILLWTYLLIILYRPDAPKKAVQYFPIIKESDNLENEISQMQYIIYRINKRNQRFFFLLSINWVLLIIFTLFFIVGLRF